MNMNRGLTCIFAVFFEGQFFLATIGASNLSVGRPDKNGTFTQTEVLTSRTRQNSVQLTLMTRRQKSAEQQYGEAQFDPFIHEDIVVDSRIHDGDHT